MDQKLLCLGILIIGSLLVGGITDLGWAQSTPAPGTVPGQSDVEKVMKDLEGSKVREDMIKSTLQKLEKLEREMREEKKKSDIKLGEEWIKLLDEPEKKK